MLEVSDLHAYYGLSHVVQGINLEVPEGKIVCLLGRNGAGKSTTIKSIMGIKPPRISARIQYRGINLAGLAPEQIARKGITYVPEERRIFPELTVSENLKIAELYSHDRQDGWTIEKIAGLFPVLESRRNNLGSHLSGGEQQMLAIARALIANPDLILMDEPSEGLAPLLVETVANTITEIKRNHITILLVEQNFDMTVELGDFFYVINKGKVAFSGPRTQIVDDKELRRLYLSV